MQTGLWFSGVSGYDDPVTKLLEHALEKLQALPPEMQDEIARMVLTYAGDEEPVIDLTPEEEASFRRSFKQAARNEFATDEEVRAIWAKHDL